VREVVPKRFLAMPPREISRSPLINSRDVPGSGAKIPSSWTTLKSAGAISGVTPPTSEMPTEVPVDISPNQYSHPVNVPVWPGSWGARFWPNGPEMPLVVPRATTCKNVGGASSVQYQSELKLGPTDIGDATSITKPPEQGTPNKIDAQAPISMSVVAVKVAQAAAPPGHASGKTILGSPESPPLVGSGSGV